jgi:tRNA-Thr(GGU) m(6)t(6)A37 methyltransferase TsaA
MEMKSRSLLLRPIGRVHSDIKERWQAPLQGRREKTAAQLEIFQQFTEAIEDVRKGDTLWVLLWFHKADRELLKVHPRGDLSKPLKGLFSTRSPSRPNPIALSLVDVIEVSGNWLKVRGLDALDGTPVIDIKPYLEESDRP